MNANDNTEAVIIYRSRFDKDADEYLHANPEVLASILVVAVLVLMVGSLLRKRK